LQNSLAAIAKPVIPSMPSRCKFLSIYAMDVKSIITCHLISLQIPGVPLCLVHCLLVGPHARNQSNLVALIRPESTQREPPLPSQVPVPPALAHRSHWPDIPHAAIVSQSSGRRRSSGHAAPTSGHAARLRRPLLVMQVRDLLLDV
jgi:hypothetical protein